MKNIVRTCELCAVQVLEIIYYVGLERNEKCWARCDDTNKKRQFLDSYLRLPNNQKSVTLFLTFGDTYSYFWDIQ